MAENSGILHRLFSLEGKVALVTGASGGIGRALAAGLAEAGAAVAVHGRKVDEVNKSCEQVEAAGRRSLPLVAELSERGAVQRLVDETCAHLGRLDILINCAATNRRKPIAEVTEDDYDFIMNVNLKSLYFLTQAAYPVMREQGGGKVIHVGSINVQYALDTVSVYGASKGGVHQLTKIMAVEWAPDNIQVNCIVPGFIYTPLSAPLWADPQKSHWFRARLPTRRPGQPEELVGLALFLASHASDYITGQCFTIDGGFTAGGSWTRDELV
ncbi:MAG TPA: glucose 1-dehydrogenase [Caldilineaceae bacterium]|nr:glucose 1-dehydrogenase [Caldilineaceae bacterium]